MKIVLASHSPRRQELLKGLGVDFSVNVINGIDAVSYTHLTLPTMQ